MIKLTQLLYSISEKAEKKIQDMSQIYQESVREAEIVGEDIPPVPTYKLKDEDYNITKQPLFIQAESIESVSKTVENDTVVVSKSGKEYLVEETPRYVYNQIAKA